MKVKMNKWYVIVFLVLSVVLTFVNTATNNEFLSWLIAYWGMTGLFLQMYIYDKGDKE